MLGRELRHLGALRREVCRRGAAGCWGIFKLECSHDASAAGGLGATLGGRPCAATFLVKGAWQRSQVSLDFVTKIELKSLILAQIERWRHALHMQVERGEGATPHSVANG